MGAHQALTSSLEPYCPTSRCFVRVNGVRARVPDTRFVCDGDGSEVLRERSWREGVRQAQTSALVVSCRSPDPDLTLSLHYSPSSPT